jgi:hypothetical protein
MNIPYLPSHPIGGKYQLMSFWKGIGKGKRRRGKMKDKTRTNEDNG